MGSPWPSSMLASSQWARLRHESQSSAGKERHPLLVPKAMEVNNSLREL